MESGVSGSCRSTIKKDLLKLILGPGIHKNVKFCSTRAQVRGLRFEVWDSRLQSRVLGQGDTFEW